MLMLTVTGSEQIVSNSPILKNHMFKYQSYSRIFHYTAAYFKPITFLHSLTVCGISRTPRRVCWWTTSRWTDCDMTQSPGWSHRLSGSPPHWTGYPPGDGGDGEEGRVHLQIGQAPGMMLTGLHRGTQLQTEVKTNSITRSAPKWKGSITIYVTPNLRNKTCLNQSQMMIPGDHVRVMSNPCWFF